MSEKKPRRTTKKKRSLADLPSQPDPRASLDAPLLVSALQPLRKLLEDDLLARAKASRAIQAALKKRYDAEKEAERTADAFAVWQRRFVEQVAAAWILSCVFVRTLEDRGLLESARIAGPGALDAQRTFLQLAPSLSEREYLLTLFREMTRLPAAAGLFDSHNPVWALAPSAEGAKALLAFFRAGGEDAPALRFGQPDTRFLGDLYQDLNESVRERFALLQTPDFVERFILDRTLEPAIAKFGLDDADLIDPTCGSGHFLLGAFDRLFEHRLRAAPGMDPREAAHAALDKVYGADINPYAVAIAKFRLTLSYLDKAGYTKISEAPKLPLHLAVADSLLYNPQHAQGDFSFLPGLEAAFERRAFDFEHVEEARDVLHRQYAAVVGNPPYITVKDAKLREKYRKLYSSAAGKYSLSVPFAERFFQLARPGGRVGQITANSFMKREFGKKLIEEYLPSIDLDLIVNTSGAYIPGHGTPTVLLFGTPDEPQGAKVKAVLAKRGEPSTPSDPAKGHVWSSIAAHWDELGFENDYISVAEVDREVLGQHPWSLAGGGASELKAFLEERAEKTLGEIADSIGIASFTLEDDVYLRPHHSWSREGIADHRLRPMVIGEGIRDWSIGDVPTAFFPYDEDLAPIDDSTPELRALWPWRTNLANNMLFGGKTKVQGGLRWHEYGRFTKDKLRTPLTIAFAFVATHNHFVLDRGGKVFKQTAPIIKLPETATEEDHLALLAYLNSSTACFWMKQVCQPRTVTTGEKILQPDPAKLAYEFAGNPIKGLPIPIWPLPARLEKMGAEMVALAEERAALLSNVLSGAAAKASADLETVVASGERGDTRLLGRMSALQEQIDLCVYELFGLAEAATLDSSERRSPAATAGMDILPPDERWHVNPTSNHPLAGSIAAFVQHSAAIREIEQAIYKRRWIGVQGRFAAEGQSFRSRVARALEDMVLGHVEGTMRAAPSTSPLPVLVAALQVSPSIGAAEWITSTDSSALVRPLGKLIQNEAVPFLAAYRYTDKGMEKRAAWEATWDLQRREDAGEKVGDIPVPPKYDQKDFRDPSYWRLRGKLDVPKERFISYPGCESDEDGEPVYGWAGWDHAQRAQALVALYEDRKTREGWDKDRLIPMLAGVLELLPWLKQWHSQPMPDYDTTFFEAYDAFLDTELRALALTREDLQSWRPPEKKKRRAK